MSDDEIVPFGKYKDQPIEVMLADRGYTEWLRAQPWLADRYTKVYNVIVGAGVESQDTPEHNALQARFLNHTEALRLVRLPALEEALDPWLRIVGKCTEEQQANLIPPTTVVSCIEQLSFEASGWDVAVATKTTFAVGERHQDYPKDWLVVEGRRWADDTPYSFARDARVRRHGAVVELKPTIGDDYPSILRSVIKRRDRGGYPFRAQLDEVRVVVLAEEVTCTSVTLDQVKAIFASQDVGFLTLAELPAPMPCACESCVTPG